MIWPQSIFLWSYFLSLTLFCVIEKTELIWYYDVNWKARKLLLVSVLFLWTQIIFL